MPANMSAITEVLSGMGALLKIQGKHVESLVVLAKCLAISNEQFGENHYSSAHAACTMASVLLDQGKYAETLALFKPAQVTITAALGETHANAEWICRQMARAYKAQGQYAKSLAQLARLLAVALEK